MLTNNKYEKKKEQKQNYGIPRIQTVCLKIVLSDFMIRKPCSSCQALIIQIFDIMYGLQEFRKNVKDRSHKPKKKPFRSQGFERHRFSLDIS